MIQFSFVRIYIEIEYTKSLYGNVVFQRVVCMEMLRQCARQNFSVLLKILPGTVSASETTEGMITLNYNLLDCSLHIFLSIALISVSLAFRFLLA